MLNTASLTHRRPLAARLGPPLVAGLLLACAFVGLFTAAVHAPRPNGVGVAVVAPPPMERQLEQRLARAVPGGFDLERGFYETLAHALPGGAALTALRSAVYFDGAAIWGLVAVLGAWAVAGLVVELAAAGRRPREAA